MAETTPKKNVVVVGGGAGGAVVARSLSGKLDASQYNLILVNERPYGIHIVAGARLTVDTEGALEDKAFMSYDKLFLKGNGSVKVGKVVDVTEAAPGEGGEVVLEDGEKIPYAVLILATGSSWQGPVDFPADDAALRLHIRSWRKKYENAKHVVVVGGGAVGVEIAGEVKELYPGKKVTIVHSEKQLLNSTYSNHFRGSVENRARFRGIGIILEDSVLEFPAEGTVGLTTKNGKTLEDADLVVAAFGPRPRTAYLETISGDVLTKSGTVKVEPTLQVIGHPSIFALGDIIEWKEQKQAAKAEYAHAPVVIDNVLKYLAGQPLKKQYKGIFEFIILPLGKSGGAAYFDVLWGITLGDWFARLTKGKDLFLGRARSVRGL